MLSEEFIKTTRKHKGKNNEKKTIFLMFLNKLPSNFLLYRWLCQEVGVFYVLPIGFS
jgi:hypothetical protein